MEELGGAVYEFEAAVVKALRELRECCKKGTELSGSGAVAEVENRAQRWEQDTVVEAFLVKYAKGRAQYQDITGREEAHSSVMPLSFLQGR